MNPLINYDLVILSTDLSKCLFLNGTGNMGTTRTIVGITKPNVIEKISEQAMLGRRQQ